MFISVKCVHNITINYTITTNKKRPKIEKKATETTKCDKKVTTKQAKSDQKAAICVAKKGLRSECNGGLVSPCRYKFRILQKLMKFANY